jgi:hypothetical protein
MGKLHELVTKYSPGAAAGRALLGKSTYDAIHPLGTGAAMQYDAAKAAEKAAKAAEDEVPIPLPDEEAIDREARRNAARRRRATTVFSTDEGFGG